MDDASTNSDLLQARANVASPTEVVVELGYVDPHRVPPTGRVTAEEADLTDQLQSFDANAMPWGELYIDQLKLGVRLKASVSDPDTGMSVQMIRYARGNVRPGQLRLVPEGMLMEHGATEDGDMTALFITNKPFDIRYDFEDEHDSSG